jgi:acetoin utilization deacetylase AcuC-like enzyme
MLIAAGAFWRYRAAMPLLLSDPRFLEHETGRHPECPARLAAISRRIAASGIAERFANGTCRAASREDLHRVHTPQYVEAVERFAALGGGRIEIDTVVCPESFDVALLAAGTAVAAVDAVLCGEHRQAVCLVRPPGHHALAGHPMGFCLFNNAAVAARHAQAAFGLNRVLVVDWDVHHGNGTQDTFYEDGSVWFLSAHRWPFYPGTGSANETGTGPGLGTTFNLPLRFGLTRREYLTQFESLLADVVTRCRPELILVSAGFDAHAADPIGSLGLESEDFEDLTRLVIDAANQHCHGRLVSMLEGGYDLRALSESVECHLRTILESQPA